MTTGTPERWLRLPLGDVADVQLGKMLDKAKHTTGQRLPYLRNLNVRWGGFDLEDLAEMFFEPSEGDRYALRPGDVIVCEGGEPGRAAVWDGRMASMRYQKALHRVRPCPSVLPKWLVYALMHDAERGLLTPLFTGTTIKHFTRTAILGWKVAVPPLGEQGRAVEALDSYLTRLDAASAALARVEANLKRYGASVLKAAVEGRLVPTEAELARKEGRDYEPASALLDRILRERRRRWEETELQKLRAKGKEPKNEKWKAKYKEPEAPDLDELPELPEGWCWATVDQLGEAITGNTPSTKNDAYFGGSLPFFKPTDLDAGYETAHARQHLTEAGARQARVLPPLAVLVTCIGATIGKTGLTRVACATNQQINALVPDPAIRETKYLYWFFVSPWGQDSVLGNASSTTLPILNKSRFERLPVPLPPLAEQERIVEQIDARISVANATTRESTNQLTRIARLRQAILKWALEGKLVDQDPNDEPAEILLERIWQEHEAKGPKKRTRRTRRTKVAARAVTASGSKSKPSRGHKKRAR